MKPRISDPRKTSSARKLRRESTDAEKLLWQRLRSSQLGGYRFRRQHPVGPYIADFCCSKARVIVELDGSQHFDEAEYDEQRDSFLKGQGYTVLRYWNSDFLKNQDGVLEDILNHCDRSPQEGK